MASTLPADSDPSQADSLQDVPADILDTTEAGPKVIRGSLLRLGAYVLGTLATVASSAVVIRHLGVVDTGRLITVTAIVSILATVSDLGLTGVAVRDYSTGPGSERKRTLRNLLGIRVSIAVTGLVIAVVFAVVVGYPHVMVIGTAIAALGTLFLILQDGCTIPLQVNLRLGWVAGLQLGIQAGVAIEAVLLVLAGAALPPFFALQLPVALLALFLTILIGGQDARLVPKFEAREWRRMIHRILPYSGAVVLSVIYFQVAQIMVSLLSNANQTGYFGVSFRVLIAFTTLPPLLVSSALPLLARAARDDAARFGYASRRLVETMVIAGCGLALALFLGAHFAIAVVAGPQFGHSVVVLRILAVALAGTFIISARGYALLSLDRLRAMLISNALALAVVLALGVILISAHGAVGAAIAMVFAEFTLAASYEYSITRDRPELKLGAGFVVRIVAAAVASGVVVIVLGLSPIVGAVVGSALYATAVLALGVVPPEIRETLLSRRDRSTER